MGVFGAIRDAIFGRPGQPQQQAQAQAQRRAMPQMAEPGAEPRQRVDVEAVLEEVHRDKGSPDLHWRSSIVDLMKLLDLDSSLDRRSELARELGYSGEADGSAEMNLWLYRRVMQELEKSGGRVPASLKD